MLRFHSLVGDKAPHPYFESQLVHNLFEERAAIQAVLLTFRTRGKKNL
jgi:hypothetical protein